AHANPREPARGFGVDARDHRQAPRGLANASLVIDVVAVLPIPAQVQVYPSHTRLHFHAAQVETAHVQARLAGAEVDFQVNGNLVAELDIPAISGVAEGVVRLSGLAYGERAASGDARIFHFRFPGRDVEGE